MAGVLLGIDIGLTVVKSALFDVLGKELSVGQVTLVNETPAAGWVEQDPEKYWLAVVETVRTALGRAGVTGSEVSAVGVTGWGDGVILLDQEGRTLGRAILSTDTRAAGIIHQWETDGTMDRLIPIMAHAPYSASAVPLFTWLRHHDPQRCQSARWALFVKDFIRYRLTGEMTSEPTDMSASLMDVRTGGHADEALRITGNDEFIGRLPPILPSRDVAGRVNRYGAEMTGLAQGTPVVGGLHDVSAAGLGCGCVQPGDITMIAGTWCINHIITPEPRIGKWLVRAYSVPGHWIAMSSSPASATNLEWFVSQLCHADVAAAGDRGVSRWHMINEQVSQIPPGAGGILYHPYLYGSPLKTSARAGFYGVGGWHTRAHLTRAVYEGVVFNHYFHLDKIRPAGEFGRIRLTGGGSRSPLWSQIFADVTGQPLVVPAGSEIAALGAALLAAVGTGLYSSEAEAAAAAVKVERVHEPDPKLHAIYQEWYQQYRRLTTAMEAVWDDLQQAAGRLPT